MVRIGGARTIAQLGPMQLLKPCGQVEVNRSNRIAFRRRQIGDKSSSSEPIDTLSAATKSATEMSCSRKELTGSALLTGADERSSLKTESPALWAGLSRVLTWWRNWEAP